MTDFCHVLNPSIHFMVEGEKENRQIAAYSTHEGGKIVIWENMNYDSQTQINQIEWHYTINGKFNSIQNLDMLMFFP